MFFKEINYVLDVKYEARSHSYLLLSINAGRRQRETRLVLSSTFRKSVLEFSCRNHFCSDQSSKRKCKIMPFLHECLE